MATSPETLVETSAPASPFFSKFPREIRDKIYELAYAEQGFSQIVSVEARIEREKDMRTYPFKKNKEALKTLKTAPADRECPLLQALVNRQFFQEATESWFRRTTVATEGLSECRTLLGSSDLLRTCIIHLKTEWWSPEGDFECLSMCKTLQTLSLEIHEGAFDDIRKRLCCVHILTDIDFALIVQVQRVLAIQSLCTIELIPGNCNIAKTEEEEGIWRQNVAALETYINQKLAAREEETDTADPHTAERYLPAELIQPIDDLWLDDVDPEKQAKIAIDRRCDNSQSAHRDAGDGGELPEDNELYHGKGVETDGLCAVDVAQSAAGSNAGPHKLNSGSEKSTEALQDTDIATSKTTSCLADSLRNFCQRHSVAVAGIAAGTALMTAVNTVILLRLLASG